MERWHSLGCKIALSIGLLFAPLTVIAQTEANIPEVEESDVATLPAPSSHWITALSFFDSSAARIIDGDSGKVLGAVHVAPMSSIVFAPDGKHIYVAETIWTKGNRGTRQDMVTVYDARTLKLETEIPLSGRLLTGYRHALFAISTDGKTGYVYNMSPASSVIVVDLVKHEVLSEVEIAGCAMVFATSKKSVGTICGDGTFSTIELSKISAPVITQTPVFFAPDDDPIFDNAIEDRMGSRVFMLSYSGTVYEMGMNGKNEAPASWSLNIAANMEAASTKPLTLAWRPGGRQIMAYNGPTNRLYVLMHKGEFWTHKESGEELWEVDVTKRKVLRRYPLENHAQSVAVSNDANPLIFLNLEDSVHILDAKTLKPLHVIEGMGTVIMSATKAL